MDVTERFGAVLKEKLHDYGSSLKCQTSKKPILANLHDYCA